MRLIKYQKKQKTRTSYQQKDFIIRPGTFYFVVEQDNQTYVNFSTGEILNASKDDLIADYNKMVERRSQNIKLQSSLNIKVLLN